MNAHAGPGAAAARDQRTVVYTDGACSGNPGPGGWGWVIPDGEAAFGGAPDTTNQRMELTAALEAIRAIDGPVHVVSDSTYVVNCFRDSWWKGWLKRGWKNSKKEPVANRDLWEPMIELFQERDVTFEWVKGHSGDRWNDRADELAVQGVEAHRPAAATAAVTSAGSEPPTAATSERPAIAGHGIVVAGLRPKELGGFDENPTTKAVRARLVEIFKAKAALHDDLVVMTGLQLGTEMLAAEAARAADVPFVAVLAFPDPAARWPQATQRHFDELLDAAQDVIILSSDVPASTRQVAAAFSRRDKWYAERGSEAVIVWDESTASLRATVKAFEAAFDDDVWIVRPADC